MNHMIDGMLNARISIMYLMLLKKSTHPEITNVAISEFVV